MMKYLMILLFLSCVTLSRAQNGDQLKEWKTHGLQMMNKEWQKTTFFCGQSEKFLSLRKTYNSHIIALSHDTINKKLFYFYDLNTNGYVLNKHEIVFPIELDDQDYLAFNDNLVVKGSNVYYYKSYFVNDHSIDEEFIYDIEKQTHTKVKDEIIDSIHVWSTHCVSPKGNYSIGFNSYNFTALVLHSLKENTFDTLLSSSNGDDWFFHSGVWSFDEEKFYFDNRGWLYACIWEIDFKNGTLNKIVSEHLAEHPILINESLRNEILYCYNNCIMLARPSGDLSKEIKYDVEKKINSWQQKGEFERSADYKIRVNEKTRAQKAAQFQSEAIAKYKKQHIENIQFSTIRLSTYDADNESFLLSSPQLGEFIIPVPLNEAPSFKKHFNSAKFQNLDFVINQDRFVLTRLDIITANNKKYTFDVKNNTTYALSKIDYNFAELKVDIEHKAALNTSPQISKSTITLGKSDVDINIPVNSISNTNRFALIIGNEDYTKYQTNLSSEANVQFATNDAKVFADYAQKTLGIPNENITIVFDAIGSVMKREITRVIKMAELTKGEIIFFYAGHGFPDELTKESYLMPVDIGGANVKDGIRLSELYKQLSSENISRSSIFLDACFSGGGRNQGLLAARGVKIKPKEDEATGKLIVFSATSEDQVSLPYKDQQHGMFTYFLLKKLQESKGDITYKELANYLKEQVQLYSLKINYKEQTPDVNISSSVIDDWENWKLR